MRRQTVLRVASVAAALLVAASMGTGCTPTPDSSQPSAPDGQQSAPGGPDAGATPSSAGRERARIVAVLDGDTVMLTGDRKARLLGFNTPERDDPFSDAARDQLGSLLRDKTVYVEYDVRPLDQYGRDLVHLFLEDGTHVNEEMLLSGYSQAYTIPPNVAYADVFLEAEREAREAGRGLWQPGSLTVGISDMEPDPRGRDEHDLNGEWAEISNTGDAAASLVGVTLSDESNNVYRFGEITLAPGDRLRVHTGPGEDSARRLHWGRSQPVWNNAGDVAFLRDADGLFLDMWQVD